MQWSHHELFNKDAFSCSEKEIILANETRYETVVLVPKMISAVKGFSINASIICKNVPRTLTVFTVTVPSHLKIKTFSMCLNLRKVY